MARTARVLLGLTTALALPLLAPPLAAQGPPAAADSAANARAVVLVGVIRDTTGRPLSGAEVRVAERVVLSDDDGTFSLSVRHRDTTQVLVRRIGYRAAEALLAVAPNVQRVELAVKMVPSVVQLGTIVIRGQSMDTRLWRTGFYDRQKLGRGHLFGPEEIERHKGMTSALLYSVPSVKVERGAFGDVYALGRFGADYCPLTVYLDGVHLRWANEVGLDRIVRKQEILAMEVYPRATQVPATIGGPRAVDVDVASIGDVGSPAGEDAVAPGVAGGEAGGSSRSISLKGTGRAECGALLIWTKPFEPKKR